MPSAHVTSPPDADSLYQAAVTHLARYATTEAGLRRMLMRRVDRWANLQTYPETAAPAIAAARGSIDSVIRRLAQVGALSDVAFAEIRANSLVRAGRSNRAVQARLVAKGVAADVARAASATNDQTELAAALVLTRKRRIGPYRPSDDVSSASRMKEIGILARAGFAREIALQALESTREEAEERIRDLRR